MSSYRPSRIFASIATKLNTVPREMSDDQFVVKPNSTQVLTSSKLDLSQTIISVSATGELSLAPDRCRIIIKVESKKETAQDAKNSVTRRLDYILQCLNNHNVKESEINISKLLKRESGAFIYTTEVHAIFADFIKCQTCCNLLIEKLDNSVKIAATNFFHSQQRLDNLRKQVSILAISNAKQKASELAKYLQASIGKPVKIEEEHTSEWKGSNSETLDSNTQLFQQKLEQATVHANAKVCATFELVNKKHLKSIN